MSEKINELKKVWYTFLMALVVIADVWIIDDIAKLLTEKNTISVLGGILGFIVMIFITIFLIKQLITKLEK